MSLYKSYQTKSLSYLVLVSEWYGPIKNLSPFEMCT